MSPLNPPNNGRQGKTYHTDHGMYFGAIGFFAEDSSNPVELLLVDSIPFASRAEYVHVARQIAQDRANLAAERLLS